MEEENDLNNLTEYIFQKNFNNSKIQIDVDGIENIHDLFCFCFDLISGRRTANHYTFVVLTL